MSATPQVPPMCPLLSKLGAVSPIDPNQKAPFQIVRCQGPGCAIFVQGFDGEGKPTGMGYCAHTMTAIALSQIANAVQEFVSGTDEPDESDETPPTTPNAQ